MNGKEYPPNGTAKAGITQCGVMMHGEQHHRNGRPDNVPQDAALNGMAKGYRLNLRPDIGDT